MQLQCMAKLKRNEYDVIEYRIQRNICKYHDMQLSYSWEGKLLIMGCPDAKVMTMVVMMMIVWVNRLVMPILHGDGDNLYICIIIKWWWSRRWYQSSSWWGWRKKWCLRMNQGNGGQEVKSVLSFQFAARILPTRNTRFQWSIVSELKGKIPFTEEGEVSSKFSICCTHLAHEKYKVSLEHS